MTYAAPFLYWFSVVCCAFFVWRILEADGGDFNQSWAVLFAGFALFPFMNTMLAIVGAMWLISGKLK